MAREYLLNGRSGFPGGVAPKQRRDVQGVSVRERRERPGVWVMDITRVLKPGQASGAANGSDSVADAVEGSRRLNDGITPELMDLPAGEAEGVLHIVWAHGPGGVSDVEASGAYHGTSRGSIRVDLSSGDVERVPVSSLKKVHGWLMGVSWGILIPLSVFIMRFFNKDETRCGVVGMVFQLHRGINVMAVLASIVGISLAFAAVDEHFTYTHGFLGVLTFVLGVLQPLNALVRPAGPTSKTADKTVMRMMWEILHKSVGYLALLLGLITILTGSILITEQAGEDAGSVATAVGICMVLLVLAFVGMAVWSAVTSGATSDEDIEAMAKAEKDENNHGSGRGGGLA